MMIEQRVWNTPEPPLLMLGIDRLGLMLPYVAQGSDERDVATLGFDIVGYVAHLIHEHLGGIERKTVFRLMREIEIILRIGYDRDRERSIALFRLIARLDAGSDREGSRPKHAENKSAVRLRPEHYGPFLSVLARSPRGAAPLDLRLPLEAKPDPVRARFAAKPRCGGQTGN